jgi:hypothetical protein
MAPPEHPPIVLDFCKAKFSDFEDHLKDSPKNRDLIVRHDERIEQQGKAISRIIGLGIAILLASLGIIVTMISSTAHIASLWGTMSEKISALEKKIDKQEGGSSYGSIASTSRQN